MRNPSHMELWLSFCSTCYSPHLPPNLNAHLRPAIQANERAERTTSKTDVQVLVIRKFIYYLTCVGGCELACETTARMCVNFITAKCNYCNEITYSAKLAVPNRFFVTTQHNHRHAETDTPRSTVALI